MNTLEGNKLINQILFYDAFDEIRSADNGDTILSTVLPNNLQKLLNREYINEAVIDNVCHKWNASENLLEVDNYLLNESLCSQEEREIIVTSIHHYIRKQNA